MAKILNRTPKVQSVDVQCKSSLANPAMHHGAIAVHEFTKRYPGMTTNAVDGISFTVQPGEIFGLLGPNGAGKTTTIGALTARILPTNGTLHIMGIDVVADPMGAKRCLSIVPQLSNLDQSLRAREILTFHASYHGMPRAEREKRANDLLKELGLDKRGKDKVSRFSGGMAQRLMLARALMHAPDVLFLDEPTNKLDPQSRLFMWDRIRTLNERGVTVLLTTHDMDEADKLCGRIAIMDQGRILVLNTAAELKKLIPASTKLELSVRIPEPVSLQVRSPLDPNISPDESIRTALSTLSNVTQVEEVSLAPGREAQAGVHFFHLYTANTSSLVANAVHILTPLGAELIDIHPSRPSLEDVFIHLTGRNLRP